MKSYECNLYIRIVPIEEIYNFVVQNSFILDHLGHLNFISSTDILILFFLFSNDLGWKNDQY